MSMINYASREINCKIVYYGSGLGGKTTNLEHIYGKVQPDTRGKLISLATETERTLFFDFLPVDLGTIRGFKTRFHLYTVPGQVYYNASRKLILKGVDGIVFVADSQTERMEANQEAMQNLYDNMAEYGYDLTKMPFVIQYNKRDLPNAAPVRELQAALNPGWEITEPGRQRVTPDADKLLLLGTFIPMYVLMRPSAHAEESLASRVFANVLPFHTPLGEIPLTWWVLAIVLGRELFMTLFRQAAVRRGVVISAIGPAKWKTTFQWIWVGAAYFWFFAATLAVRQRWESLPAWSGFANFNGLVGVLAMIGAVGLTLYSLALYLQRYGRVFIGAPVRGRS
jgi:signal recognition particle receptor subunit beta